MPFNLSSLFHTKAVVEGDAPAQLKQAVAETFGTLFDHLTSLPEKDGRKFAVTFAGKQDEFGLNYDIRIENARVNDPLAGQFYAQPVHGEPQPAVGLSISLNGGKYTADVTKIREFGHPQKHFGNLPFQKQGPFAKALALIEQELEAISPGYKNRLPDIVTATPVLPPELPAGKPEENMVLTRAVTATPTAHFKRKPPSA